MWRLERREEYVRVSPAEIKRTACHTSTVALISRILEGGYIFVFLSNLGPLFASVKHFSEIFAINFQEFFAINFFFSILNHLKNIVNICCSFLKFCERFLSSWNIFKHFLR